MNPQIVVIIIAVVIAGYLVYDYFKSDNKGEYKDAGSNGAKIESPSQAQGVQGKESGSVCVRDNEKDRMETKQGKEVAPTKVVAEKDKEHGNGSEKKE